MPVIMRSMIPIVTLGIVLGLSGLMPLSAIAKPAAPEELRQKLLTAVADATSFKDRFDAEVWLTDMSRRAERRVNNIEERLLILKTVHFEANRVGLSPELVLAVIDIESRFDRFAISVVGAQGLMQIMPFWKKELDLPDANLFDVQTNIRFGCTILKHYIDKEKGNMQKGLARYNGSYGRRKYPDKVFNALSKIWYQR